MKLLRVGFAVAMLTLAGVAARAQQPAQSGRPRMPHQLAGMEQCAACHAANANPNVRSMPASHRYPPTSCATCHRPRANPVPTVPHATTESFAQCRTCHVTNSPAGAAAPPASHAEWNQAICVLCHQQAPRPS